MFSFTGFVGLLYILSLLGMGRMLQPKISKQLLAIVVASQVFVQIAFGSYGVILKAFAQSVDINPLVFSFLRDLLASPILLLAAYLLETSPIEIPSDLENGKSIEMASLEDLDSESEEETIQEGREIEPHIIKVNRAFRVPKGREWILFVFLGFTGMFGNQLLFIEGVYLTNPSVAAMFQPLIPIFTAIFALLTFTDPIPNCKTWKGWFRCFGVTAAAFGAFIMLLGNSDSQENSKGQSLVDPGILCLIGNTASMAAYVVAQQRFIFFNKYMDAEETISLNCVDRYCSVVQGNQIVGLFQSWANYPIYVTAWSYLMGAIFMGLACIYYVVTDLSVFSSIDENIIFPLCYSVLISSSLCYGLLTWGNKYLSSTTVTAFWPLQIATAVFLSVLLLNTSISFAQWIGGFFIFTGLIGVTLSKS